MDHMHEAERLIFTPLDLVAIALGMAAILLGVLLVVGRTTWDESPKYEMLGQQPPERTVRPRVPGRMGVEDRLVRVGVAVVALYYAASRLGFGEPVGWLLGLVGLYLAGTCALGRDLLYRRLGLDTRLPEHR